MSSLQALLKAKKQAIKNATGRREQTTKPPAGKSRFRILPSWRPVGKDGKFDPQFYHEFGQHFIKKNKDDKKPLAVYVCTDKTFDKPCPVCQAISEGISAATDDDVKNNLASAVSRGRILLNALHVDGPDPKAPVILELSPTTFDQIIDIALDNGDEDDEDFNIVTDVSAGVDVIITRTGVGLETKYSIQPALKGSKPVDPKKIGSLHNLDEYVMQEYEEGKNKAIGAISTVSGLLPPPSKPALADDSAFEDDVPEFGSDTPSTSAPEEVIEEADYEEVEPKAKEDDESISDDELNSLLDELE